MDKKLLYSYENILCMQTFHIRLCHKSHRRVFALLQRRRGGNMNLSFFFPPLLALVLHYII